jgi:hypothetical protein
MYGTDKKLTKFFFLLRICLTGNLTFHHWLYPVVILHSLSDIVEIGTNLCVYIYTAPRTVGPGIDFRTRYSGRWGHSSLSKSMRITENS